MNEDAADAVLLRCVRTDPEALEILYPRRPLDRPALHLLVPADDFSTRAATITVAPVPFVTDRRYEVPGTDWLVTHPLYVALAIARDRSRGPEFLAAWEPSGPDGFRRSW